MVTKEVETKTLSTIIGIQLLGNSFWSFWVVMQKEAFVLFAAILYLLEWKKVISSMLEFCRSLISITFKSLLISPTFNLIHLNLAYFIRTIIFKERINHICLFNKSKMK